MPKPTHPIPRLLLCALVPALASVQQAAAAPAPVAQRPAPRPLAAPASEPKDIVAVMRFRNPDATVAMLQSFLPVPGLLQSGLNTALGPLRPALSMAAPVDVLVTLDPEAGERLVRPLFAFSIGLTSSEEAQRAITGQLKGSAVEVSRGVYAVTVKVDRDEWRCTMGPAIGVAPVRIVCSDRQSDVDRLAPYLLRGMPTRDLGPADLHIEMRPQPALGRYGAALQQGLNGAAMFIPQKLQLNHPRFDRTFTDMNNALAEQINLTLNDLERVTMDMQLGQPGIELRMGYRAIGRRSWLARSVAEEAGHAAPPPPMFYRMPADLSSASYSALTYPDMLTEGLFAPVRELLDAWLDHEGLAPADRQALTTLIKLRGPRTASVWGNGEADPPAAGKKALPAPLGGTYYISGYPHGADTTRKWLVDAVAAVNRPAVLALAKKKLKAFDATLQVPVVRAVPAPKDLPAGSMEVFATVMVPADKLAKLSTPGPAIATSPKKAKGPALTPVTFTLLLMPDGERSWIAMGTDRPTLVRRLSQIARGDESQGLARRAGIGDLRGNYVSGGFFTLANVAKQFWKTMAERKGRDVEEMARALNVAPHHGETPMIFVSRSSDGGVLEREMALRVPRDIIEDIVSVTMNLAAKSAAGDADKDGEGGKKLLKAK